ncbi:hypothetical protein GCM10022221_09840 [Actinocorallia aurea]
MTHDELIIRSATEQDIPAIIELIDRRAAWLRTMGTDQWARPWPDEEGRALRIRDGLKLGKTFVVTGDGAALVATVSITRCRNGLLWKDDPADAVYLHRLVVDRSIAGRKLGSHLIHWAGAAYLGAGRIRIDVWSDNPGLHAYYRDIHFDFVDTDETGAPVPALTKEEWPSGVLLERSVEPYLSWPDSEHFTPVGDDLVAEHARDWRKH